MTKLGKDIIANVLFSAVTILFLWLLTRLSTGTMPAASLAIFMLVRRYSASLANVMCLGGPTFQIRYMAMHAEDRELGELVNVIMFALYSLMSLLVVTAIFFGLPMIQRAFFPGGDYPSWVVWYVALSSIQQLFHFIIIDNLLVYRRMFLYNIYRLLPASGFFVASFIWVRDGSAHALLGSWLVAGLALLLVGHGLYTFRAFGHLRRLPLSKAPWLLKELVVYGPPRSVISVMDSLLFVVGPWLIRDNVSEVAYLLTMFVFVQATSILVLPINELSMVLGANRVGQDRSKDLAAGAQQLLETLLVLAVIIVAALYPYRDFAYRIAIPNANILRGVSRYGLLLSCIIPLTVFNGLKGVIEVTWKAPRNLASLVISTVLGIAFFHALRLQAIDEVRAVLCASMVTFWALGALTALNAWALIRGSNWRGIGAMSLASAAVAGANAGVRELLGTEMPLALELLMIAFSAILLVLAWWWILRPRLLHFVLDALRHVLLQRRSSAASDATGG